MPETSSAVRVLVVDDDADIAEMLSFALEHNGLEVTGVAHNGREALDMAEESQPDIVLLDMAMPEVTGLEALPGIRLVAPRSRVCVHSAIGARFLTDSALEAGAVAYIEKGVRPRSIVRHLQRVMDADPQDAVHPYPLRRDYT
jgi:two-component system chemotaxis response regulator CheY